MSPTCAFWTVNIHCTLPVALSLSYAPQRKQCFCDPRPPRGAHPAAVSYVGSLSAPVHWTRTTAPKRTAAPGAAARGAQAAPPARLSTDGAPSNRCQVSLIIAARRHRATLSGRAPRGTPTPWSFPVAACWVPRLCRALYRTLPPPLLVVRRPGLTSVATRRRALCRRAGVMAAYGGRHTRWVVLLLLLAAGCLGDVMGTSGHSSLVSPLTREFDESCRLGGKQPFIRDCPGPCSRRFKRPNYKIETHRRGSAMKVIYYRNRHKSTLLLSTICLPSVVSLRVPPGREPLSTSLGGH